MLVRCNRRFEAMLGLEPGAAAGASLDEIFGRASPQRRCARRCERWRRASRPSWRCRLAEGAPTRWYSLSVRRARARGPAGTRSVAVLTDISRLKSQQAELEAAAARPRADVQPVRRGHRLPARRAHRTRQPGDGRAHRLCRSPELTALDAAELYEDAAPCVGVRGPGSCAGPARARPLRRRAPLRRRDGSLLWVQVAQRLVDGADDDGRPASAPMSTSTSATARASRWLRRPSARAPSSIRCWWASSPSATAASSG